MLITLITDFGLQDGYVGTLKGVIAGIAPEAALVDLTHDIPPQDVRAAAYVLWTALPYFPPHSVHVVVVDPGVGTARRPIVAQTPWGILVGPDNGVFSWVWAAAPPTQIVELSNPVYRRGAVSRTFHGRDVFAPAAAHLARGVPLTEFGPPAPDPVRLPLPQVQQSAQQVTGEIVYIDRFGNAITSLGEWFWEGAELRLAPLFGGEPLRVAAARTRVSVAGRDLGPVRPTYGEVAPGQPLALVGSEGLLEIAVNLGHGAAALGLRPGAPVTLAW